MENIKKLIIILGLLLPAISFAILPVNKPLISFTSATGKGLLESSHHKADFYHLMPYFVTQKNLAYCAIASSAMVLNAIGATKPLDAMFYPYKIFTQSNIFIPKVLEFLTPTKVSAHGVTLTQEKKLLEAFGVKTQLHYGDHIALAEFRKLAIAAIDSGNSYILVNFHRSNIGEKGGGHFSPLAAYNEASDRFLLLDVARYKYPPVWVTAEKILAAMDTQDNTSHKSRGFIIVKL